MPWSFDRIAAEAPDGSKWTVNIASNQDDGIASYAEGELVFRKGRIVAFERDGIRQPFLQPARLHTTDPRPLLYFFSNRSVMSNGAYQPFDGTNIDLLGLDVYKNASDQTVAAFTLLSYDKARFEVVTETRDSILVGAGPSVGNAATAAHFLISFMPAPRL